MTNNCEIVDNVACGQAFKYCRTHKVEPHQCPGAKTDSNPYSGIMENLAKVHATALNKDFQKREFKVGDKVHVVEFGIFPELAGKIVSITSVYKAGSISFNVDGKWVPSKEDHYAFEGRFAFPARCLEHV